MAGLSQAWTHCLCRCLQELYYIKPVDLPELIGPTSAEGLLAAGNIRGGGEWVFLGIQPMVGGSILILIGATLIRLGEDKKEDYMKWKRRWADYGRSWRGGVGADICNSSIYTFKLRSLIQLGLILCKMKDMHLFCRCISNCFFR